MRSPASADGEFMVGRMEVGRGDGIRGVAPCRTARVVARHAAGRNAAPRCGARSVWRPGWRTGSCRCRPARRAARSLEYLRLRLRYERLRTAVRRRMEHLRLRLRYEPLRAAVRRRMEYLRLRLRDEPLRAAGRRSWAGTRSCPTCRAPGWLRSCAAGRAAPARCRRLRLRRGVATGRGYAGTGWGRALAYMRQAFAGSTGAPPSTSTTACSQGGCSRVQTVMGRGRCERCEASRAKWAAYSGGRASVANSAIAKGSGG